MFSQTFLELFFLKDPGQCPGIILISREQLHCEPVAHQEYLMDGPKLVLLPNRHNYKRVYYIGWLTTTEAASVGAAGSIAFNSFAPASIQCFASSCNTVNTCWVVRKSLLNTWLFRSFQMDQIVSMARDATPLLFSWQRDSDRYQASRVSPVVQLGGFKDGCPCRNSAPNFSRN